MRGAMAALNRRVLLALCASVVALPAHLLRAAEPAPNNDELVVVDGWLLKRSDLRQLGL